MNGIAGVHAAVAVQEVLAWFAEVIGGLAQVSLNLREGFIEPPFSPMMMAATPDTCGADMLVPADQYQPPAEPVLKT